MEIKRVEVDKKRYLDLLLGADEQEDRIGLYLEGGPCVLEDDGVGAECVVTDKGSGILGLKSIAVSPTTTTTPSTSAGCSWWTWCTCKESYENWEITSSAAAASKMTMRKGICTKIQVTPVCRI